MIICKEFTFDSAHQLKNYKGKCANLHGHTYKLQVFLKGKIQKNGLVFDFVDLKKIVKASVLDKLDHMYINNIIDQPSAENICLWIWHALETKVPIYEVRLWETPTSLVYYKGEN